MTNADRTITAVIEDLFDKGESAIDILFALFVATGVGVRAMNPTKEQTESIIDRMRSIIVGDLAKVVDN
jgi:hypothetical protein